jgi:ATP-dependent 26S proteasome regulatory subunit
MINKLVTTILLCLLIVSCGGKSNKRDSADRSKRNMEIIEKRKAEKKEREKKREETKEAQEEKFQRNEGNYRKPTQRPKGESKLRRKVEAKPVVTTEEDPAVARSARIEKRVKLEVDIWKAGENGDAAMVEKLRKEADELVKEMRQDELDEAYKKIKDIKKRM